MQAPAPTPKRNASTIMLPPARIAQLHAIGKARGLNLTETVERLIRQEVQAGTIPDELPGFEVALAQGHVFLAMGEGDTGFGWPPLKPKQALVVAELLERVARGGASWKIDLADGMAIGAARVGRGTVLIGTDDDMDRRLKATMTAQMMGDLARIVQRTALEALSTAPVAQA